MTIKDMQNLNRDTIAYISSIIETGMKIHFGTGMLVHLYFVERKLLFQYRAGNTKLLI